MADVIVLFDMRLYRNSNRLKELSKSLSAKGLSFQYALIEDAILNFPLNKDLLNTASNILVPVDTYIGPDLEQILQQVESKGARVYWSVQDAIENIHPRAAFSNHSDYKDFRCFIRQSDDQIVIHIVNRHPSSIQISRELDIELEQLGLNDNSDVMVFKYPNRDPINMVLKGKIIKLPAPSVWDMVLIRK